MLKQVVMILLVQVIFFTNAYATNENTLSKKDVPEFKQTKNDLYITSKQAFHEIQNSSGKILFLDIRTRAEVAMLGMPTVADANVPYMLMSEPMTWNEEWGGFEMVKNKKFLQATIERIEAKGLAKDDKIFLMCRSGGRSASAADKLAEAGYTNVYTVVDGFEGDKAKNGKRILNGWKNSGLPWSYKLDKNKMFLSK